MYVAKGTVMITLISTWYIMIDGVVDSTSANERCLHQIRRMQPNLSPRQRCLEDKPIARG